jgi:hypothetical protein
MSGAQLSPQFASEYLFVIRPRVGWTLRRNVSREEQTRTLYKKDAIPQIERQAARKLKPRRGTAILVSLRHFVELPKRPDTETSASNDGYGGEIR